MSTGPANGKPPTVLPPLKGDGAPPALVTSCDTSMCTVKFSTDIFPYMQATGSGLCSAANCHGGSQAPLMSSDDPVSTYSSFLNYTVSGTSMRYVQPCADPSESGILCNLQSMCGSAMPINGGAAATTALIQKITDWLKCGAPNN
jgi:hypothetical protein